MEILEKQVVSDKTIVLDDKTLVDGDYTNCTLIYSGGEFTSINTKFNNCQVTLAGAAQRVAAFLGSMGILPPPPGAPTGGNFGFPKKPNGIQ